MVVFGSPTFGGGTHSGMERRGSVVAAIFIGGIVCAVGLAITTGACHAHLYATWLARMGSGPPAPLPLVCVPSDLANRYVIDVLLLALRVALPVAGVALVVSVAGRLISIERSLHARRLVAWINVGALALMMIAAVTIAGSGDGEVQFYAIPWLLIGGVPACIGSFAGARKPPGAMHAK
jgi:hypothetical protein